mgnify:CR=1 FL=1
MRLMMFDDCAPMEGRLAAKELVDRLEDRRMRMELVGTSCGCDSKSAGSADEREWR